MGMPLESAKQWSDLKNMRPRLTFDTGQPNTGLKIDTVTIQVGCLSFFVVVRDEQSTIIKKMSTMWN